MIFNDDRSTVHNNINLNQRLIAYHPPILIHSLTLLEPRKNILLRLLKFPQNSLPMLFRPHNWLTSIRLGAVQKPLLVAFYRIHRIHFLPSFHPYPVLELERPQQLRYR